MDAMTSALPIGETDFFRRGNYAPVADESIAGVFRIFETIPPELVGKPVQAWLDGDDLKLARVGASA